MLLRFRAPGHPLTLAELLRRALPGESEAFHRELARNECVRTGSRTRTDLGRRVPPGTHIEVELPSGVASIGADSMPLRKTHAWRVLTPVLPWRRGSLPMSSSAEAPAELRFETLARRDGVAELLVWVDRHDVDPPDHHETPLGGDIRVGSRTGDAEGAVEDVDSDWGRCAVALAGAGFPILGDVLNGGVAVQAGLCARSAAEPTPPSVESVESDEAAVSAFGLEGAWPTEAVIQPTPSPELPALRISKESERIVARGHPWILEDAQTGDASHLWPGTPVRLVDSMEETRALAYMDGTEPVLARVWAVGPARLRDAPSVEARIAKAIARRRALIDESSDPSRSNAYRLVHGEGDDLPGLFVDRLGGALRVLISSRVCEAHVERATEALCGALHAELGDDPPVIEVVHLRRPPTGEFECVRVARGAAPQPDSVGRLEVMERGLKFGVDLGLETPRRSSPGVGLFLDQRENRERLATRAAGGRWVNLFAHTGAFSAALLAGGAEAVTSVDLSAPYLEWLNDNLMRNGLATARHEAAQRDARRWLAEQPPDARFDGIILDPPTAAAAGRRFWSVKRELGPLLVAALKRLEFDGHLFVSRNDRVSRDELARQIQDAAASVGISVDFDEAGPGSDFPHRRSFPEGNPHVSVLAQRVG